MLTLLGTPVAAVVVPLAASLADSIRGLSALAPFEIGAAAFVLAFNLAALGFVRWAKSVEAVSAPASHVPSSPYDRDYKRAA